MQSTPLTTPNLEGIRVLLTRPAGEGQEEWQIAFAKHGAIPVVYPTVTIMPPSSWSAVDEAIVRLETFNWLVFTSATAVRFFVGRIPAGTLCHAPLLAAVGPKTAAAVQHAGGQRVLVANDPRQEGLFELLKPLVPSTHILIPQAEQTRPFLVQALREMLCEVCVVSVYRTVPIIPLPPVPEFDVAIFASPSAFQAFLAKHAIASLQGKSLVAIGSTTAENIRSVGLEPRVARKPTIDSLIETVALSWQPIGEP